MASWSPARLASEPMSIRKNFFLTLLTLLLAAGALAPAASAQEGNRSAASVCDYSRCALTIIPRLSALDVVRGDTETRVASLAFLFPRSVSAIFDGNDAARRHAARAFSQR